jgi:hypothetical protein
MTVDNELAKLQSPLPRAVRRRRKTGQYDAWQSEKETFRWLLASILCAIAGWFTMPWGFILLVFGGLLTPIFLSLNYWSLINTQQHKFLVKHGHAAMGWITESEFVTTGDMGSDSMNLTYEFRTDYRVKVKRKWEGIDYFFWECKPGDRFIVLYDPEDPSQNIAYDSALYEVK